MIPTFFSYSERKHLVAQREILFDLIRNTTSAFSAGPSTLRAKLLLRQITAPNLPKQRP